MKIDKRLTFAVIVIVAGCSFAIWRAHSGRTKPATVARPDVKAAPAEVQKRSSESATTAPAPADMARQPEKSATSNPGAIAPPASTPVTRAPSYASSAQSQSRPADSDTPSATATVLGTQSQQVGGTAGMIAAHSALRTPEFADPDSQTNQRILEMMIRKAVARSAATSTRTNSR